MVRVAVLDDDEDDAHSTAEILNACGLDSHPFVKFDALMASGQVQPFGAFVLDWGLGHETAAPSIATLRSCGYPATPIILLTGNTGGPDFEAVHEAVKKWALQLRTKPYSGKRLATEIRALAAAAGA